MTSVPAASVPGASVPGEAVRGQSRWFARLGPQQRTVLISWTAFTATFLATRGLTYAIRTGHSPIGNLHAGGVHLHHYLWGIQLLAASGGVAIYGNGRYRNHPAVVVAYATGWALVVDEFAMLVHLKDVYWSRLGRSSVLIGTALIALEGAGLACIPAWRGRRLSQPSD